MTNKPRRNRGSEYAQLVTPFGRTTIIRRARALQYLEADLALYERLCERGETPSFAPYVA